MQLSVRKASVNDGMDVYRLLQQLPRDENGFTNSPVREYQTHRKHWHICFEQHEK